MSLCYEMFVIFIISALPFSRVTKGFCFQKRKDDKVKNDVYLQEKIIPNCELVRLKLLGRWDMQNKNYYDV